MRIKREYDFYDNLSFDLYLDRIEKILSYADKLTAKFIEKCDMGHARSKETYAECKKLSQMLYEVNDDS